MEETLESKPMDIDTNIKSTEEVANGTEAVPSTSDLQNPNDTSSDSDSDSDDEDDEAQQYLQIQSLETELSSNPSNYDVHVQYITLLRKMGLIDKLREAREAMNALFPLTPQMWLEWTKDETSLLNGSEAFSVIEKLYERGVHDYLSITLWCDYINFVQEYDPSVRERSDAGILRARNLFERALTAAGLHIAEGSKIWEAYIEFELSIYRNIDDTNAKEKEKQAQRVRSIFHRELSVPHGSLMSTLVAYKTWESEKDDKIDAKSCELDGISSHVASAYQKALKMYNARIHFEEHISRENLSDPERLQQYMKYLKFEQSSGDPARVQILFERAIADFPISTDLWLDYTCYLDKTLKGATVVRGIYLRATRNCSWVGELWVRYLLSLERGLAPEKDISNVFEKSLQCTFSSFDEYLNLFLTRIDGLRRRISLAREAEDAVNFALIRDTFQHASDYLSPHLKNTVGLLRLYAYWAHLELSVNKDLAVARSVWENLLKISGSMIEVWQGYITMEIESGHIHEARSIYKRCYSKRFPEMGSEDICNSWLFFERKYGSLEDFDNAVNKVTPRLEELKFYRSQQESKAVAGPTTTEQNQNSNKKREKRKPDITEEQPSAKRQKDSTTEISKKKKGKKDKGKKSQAESSEVGEVKAKVNIPESSKKEQGIKPKLYTDQCTVFISNLNAKTNDENLRDFFKDVGGVVAIRILKDKYTGNSRGLAYIDFCDESHLSAAVAKNRQTLLGKKLSIAKSDPKHNKHTGPARSSSHKDETMQPRLKGKNTFAVPRNVKPLGWTQTTTDNEKKQVEEEDTPKSNDDFRKALLKK